MTVNFKDELNDLINEMHESGQSILQENKGQYPLTFEKGNLFITTNSEKTPVEQIYIAGWGDSESYFLLPISETSEILDDQFFANHQSLDDANLLAVAPILDFKNEPALRVRIAHINPINGKSITKDNVYPVKYLTIESAKTILVKDCSWNKDSFTP